MNNSIFMQILNSFHDFLEVLFSLILRNGFFSFKKMVKILVSTKFSDNIHVVSSLINIMKLDYVLVIDHFHDIYFGLDILEIVRVKE